jgi:hypothetical protein
MQRWLQCYKSAFGSWIIVQFPFLLLVRSRTQTMEFKFKLLFAAEIFPDKKMESIVKREL